jgi:hypothetical protein
MRILLSAASLLVLALYLYGDASRSMFAPFPNLVPEQGLPVSPVYGNFEFVQPAMNDQYVQQPVAYGQPVVYMQPAESSAAWWTWACAGAAALVAAVAAFGSQPAAVADVDEPDVEAATTAARSFALLAAEAADVSEDTAQKVAMFSVLGARAQVAEARAKEPQMSSNPDAPVKIGINGFGRMGRRVLRVAMQHPDFVVKHINSSSLSLKKMKHLLENEDKTGKRDPHLGIDTRFKGTVEVTDTGLKVNGFDIPVSHIPEPSEIPWYDADVDYVCESTGKFTTTESCAKHIEAGAKKVIVAGVPTDYQMPFFGLYMFEGYDEDLMKEKPNYFYEKYESATMHVVSSRIPERWIRYSPMGYALCLAELIEQMAIKDNVLDRTLGREESWFVPLWKTVDFNTRVNEDVIVPFALDPKNKRLERDEVDELYKPYIKKGKRRIKDELDEYVPIFKKL